MKIRRLVEKARRLVEDIRDVTSVVLSYVNLARLRKALVPLAVGAIGFVAAKLGLDIPADQAEVIAIEIVTAVLVYLARNED